MMGHSCELFPNELFLGYQFNPAGIAHQFVGYENCDVVVMDLPVRRRVFSFEVGVDRHLFSAASTNGVDVVHGSGAAL